jgi:hypothetical protein
MASRGEASRSPQISSGSEVPYCYHRPCPRDTVRCFMPEIKPAGSYQSLLKLADFCVFALFEPRKSCTRRFSKAAQVTIDY